MPHNPAILAPSAFTATAKARVTEIVVDVSLSLPYLPNVTAPPEPTPSPARALWDTGATNCAITKAKADQLGLPRTGKAKVGHADGESIQDVYSLNLHLPNKLIIPMVRATECKSAYGNFDFIIGMDIITLGDFALTNLGGISTISFRVPSVRTIDYVKEIAEMNARAGQKVGRNSLCYCGSGKKFKHCHGA